ncbi:MAG TPA: hypothetical protein VK510_00830, partial [Solirubrobacteraceae bacterium]|nr:hypothetical protein [Solirubrobacteraceae bacterium]
MGTVFLVERHIESDLGARARVRADAELRVDEQRSLTHAADPCGVLGKRQVDATAVVAHAQHDVAVSSTQGDRDLRGVGVSDGVGDGLLSHPVDHELGLGGQIRYPAGQVELWLDADAAVMCHAPAERQQRVGQTEVVERLGPQLANDLADIVAEGAGRLLRLAKIIADLWSA